MDHVRRKCTSAIALATTKIFECITVRLGPRGIDRAQRRADSRDAGPALHRYVFFSSPTPTSKRCFIAPCHRSAPVFTLRSTFIAAFSVFARTSSPIFQFFRASISSVQRSRVVPHLALCACAIQLRMRSSETWREFQKFLPLIRGRVLVLRGRGSSTLSVDKRYVDFRTLLRVIGTSPHSNLLIRMRGGA